jgi:S1-C subfamily serine protease
MYACVDPIHKTAGFPFMSDTPTASFSWTCPACDRRVPRKFTECRCGYTSNRSDAPPEVADHPRRPTAFSPAASVVGSAVVALTLVAVGAWFVSRPSPQRPSDRLSQPPPATAAGAPEALRAPLPPAPAATEAPPSPSVSPVPERVPPAASTVPGSLEDLVARAMPAVVRVETSSGTGSGFFVTADTLLTNVHVIAGSASVTIRRSDGTTEAARVAGTAPDFDVALLKIANPAPVQATIPLGSASGVRIGQEVVAIGSALGMLQNTVTRGIVSGVRQVGAATLVQTDAALNPGNSGGPLLDRSGSAIGINTAGFRTAQGLNFAVSIEHARALLEGRVEATSARAAAEGPLRAISPAQTAPLSDADQLRDKGLKAYQQALDRIARRADSLDDYWRRFRANCYQGKVAGSFDREWFAIWDARAMQGAVAPGCGSSFGEVQRVAAEIRDQMLGADEAARIGGVFPGVRRDLRRQHHLDYPGWDR